MEIHDYNTHAHTQLMITNAHTDIKFVHKHTFMRCTLTASAFAQCSVGISVSCLKKYHCVMFGNKKKREIILSVSFGRKTKTVCVADVSLLHGTASTLSQLKPHGGAQRTV